MSISHNWFRSGAVNSRFDEIVMASHPVLAGRGTGLVELVGDEPIPELPIIEVHGRARH